MTIKIGLIGPFGGGNLGDAAIQQAIIHNLGARGDVSFVAICGEPEGAARTLGINAVRINAPQLKGESGQSLINRAIWRMRGIIGEFRFLGYVRRTVRELDVLVFSGGGQFDDYWGGPWAHPYAIFVWTMMARLVRVPVVFASIGIDKLSPMSKRLIRRSVSAATYVSFRDAGSKAIAQTARIGKSNTLVSPDLAFSLNITQRPARLKLASLEQKVLGISPISIKAWGNITRTEYETYLDTLAVVAKTWLEKFGAVRIFVSQVSMDAECARRVVDKIRYESKAVVAEDLEYVQLESVNELCHELSRCDLVVASRLHSVLLSHVMFRPVVSLSYSRKVDQLMADCGQSQYNLNLRQARPDDLLELLESLISSYPEVVANLTQVVEENNDRLDKQYDTIIRIAFGR